MTISSSTCPLCDRHVENNLGTHIRQAHGEEAFRKAVLTAKEHGLPDADIGTRYGVSFNTLQQIITEAYGANISVLERPKRIKRWLPANFDEETTTVWSFKQRGNWATHDGRYRGNWSPYIPRNVILKYSRPGDTVLDYFVGGGTTAVEAKLLGRRCIARDINPGAVGITLENLDFSPSHQILGDTAGSFYEPGVSVGDARDLVDIPDTSADLICAHPPYAGIIKYSSNIPGDLSDLAVTGFLAEMNRVALESLRVLKPGGKCAILIGDARKSKHVVPIGFQMIRVFLDAGFILRELVIKRQHNCKTTGFWYTRSIKYNFLLLAHEYLPIFEKPPTGYMAEQMPLWEYSFPYETRIGQALPITENGAETTTVWIFPPGQLRDNIRHNLSKRFAASDGQLAEIVVGNEQQSPTLEFPDTSVIYVTSADDLNSDEAIAGYRTAVQKIVGHVSQVLPAGGFLVIEARDVRVGDALRPVGLLLWEDLLNQAGFAIKEIVVVVPENAAPKLSDNEHGLRITHRYLLIYRRQANAEES